MTESNPRPANENITADMVADYLKEHPNFLNDFPDLLSILKPPSRNMGSGISDLQQTMIHKLQDQVERTEDLAHVMIANSRENLSSTTLIHECVLRLMAAESFEELIAVINKDLAEVLQLDYVTFCIENEDIQMPPIEGIRLIPATLIDFLIPEDKMIQLNDNTMSDPNVYVEAAEFVRSEALIRLEISPDIPSALLAFGSADPERFDPSQATELLAFLAQSISELIRIWLAPPTPEAIFEGQDD